MELGGHADRLGPSSIRGSGRLYDSEEGTIAHRLTRVCLAFLAVAAVACDPGSVDGATTTPSVHETPTTSASASPALVPSGPCANEYFPVVPDAVWVYERTVDGKVNRYRQTVEALDDEGFVLLLRFGGGGERDVWTCSPAGLASVEQYITGPSGGPPPPGTVSFQHFRSDGVSVPADLEVGSSWKQVVTSHAFFTIDGVRHREDQVVTTSNRAVADERVETPLGAFDAMKIETTSTTHKTAPTFGNGIDQTTTSEFTQWWSPGVGLVKLVSTNSNGSIVLVGLRVP